MGDLGGAVTISMDLQDCHREKILLGPVCSGHTGTLSLLTTGQSGTEVEPPGTGGRNSDTFILRVTDSIRSEPHLDHVYPDIKNKQN